MLIELETHDLAKLLNQQIHNLFIISKKEKQIIESNINDVLQTLEQCFLGIDNKYYRKNGDVYFNPFHSGQYSIYLYYFSNYIFEKIGDKQRILADKIYYLNKALNGLDLFYEVKMPKVFFAEHPVGSVMGRAEYGNHFSFAQNCTVGGNKNIYPKLGNNVKMYAGSTVIGNCIVGDNVTFSANSYIKDLDIPPNSIVFGQSPNNIIKHLGD